MRRFLLVPVALAGAIAGAPAGARAASCEERLIGDWRDGRIDAVYPVACYRDALAILPEDLRLYGTAESDIQHALARRLATLAAARRARRAAAPILATSGVRPRTWPART